VRDRGAQTIATHLRKGFPREDIMNISGSLTVAQPSLRMAVVSTQHRIRMRVTLAAECRVGSLVASRVNVQV
jgi:hypothetical protein